MAPGIEVATNGHSSPAVNGMNGHTNGAKKVQNPSIESLGPNPALYTNEHRGLEFRESPELNPTETDCIVHMKTNGICGSDLHFWHAGGIGALRVDCPYVLGHEGAGTIIWVGSEVKSGLKIGDPVAIEPGLPCNEPTCHPCTTGQYNLCPEVKFTGAPPHHGSIRRYHVHDNRFLHKLSPDPIPSLPPREHVESTAGAAPRPLSYADGALLEPLSVVLHGFERSPVRLGEPILIMGAGPIGLIALTCAQASGAFPLVICDVDATRLAFAQKFVPSCTTYLISTDLTPEVLGRSIQSIFNTTLSVPPPRATFECTGVASSICTAVWATQRGGEVMVIGVGRPVLDGLPFMEASMAEIDIKFINRYHHSWPYAIRLLRSGYVDLRPLVTHRFPLEEAETAIRTAGDRTKGSIKVHIVDGLEEGGDEALTRS